MAVGAESGSPAFATRNVRSSDEPFLYSSFLKSFRESDQAEGIPSGRFFDHFKVEFALVLSRFDVLIANPEGAEDEIAGWIAYKGPVVAWVYVKRDPWRRCGVARRLWNAAGLGLTCSAVYASHWALKLARLKGLRVTMLPHGKVVRMLEGA